MMFPSLNYETVVQVGDKLRLDARLSFSPDEIITDVEIKPSPTDNYYSVFNSNSEKWRMDWAYEADGIFNIEVRLTSMSGTKSKTYQITILTEEEDALLSNDNDLIALEPTIFKYLPPGKNSFKYAHRAAQEKIIAYLDEQRYWKQDGDRYTKLDLSTISDPEFKDQFRQWSKYQTLLLLFESFQINRDDFYEEKRRQYEDDLVRHRNRASLRLDQDGDGKLDEGYYDFRTTRMIRR